MNTLIKFDIMTCLYPKHIFIRKKLVILLWNNCNYALVGELPSLPLIAFSSNLLPIFLTHLWARNVTVSSEQLDCVTLSNVFNSPCLLSVRLLLPLDYMQCWIFSKDDTRGFLWRKAIGTALPCAHCTPLKDRFKLISLYLYFYSWNNCLSHHF